MTMNTPFEIKMPEGMNSEQKNRIIGYLTDLQKQNITEIVWRIAMPRYEAHVEMGDLLRSIHCREDLQLELVEYSGLIQYFENPTEMVQLKAVRNDRMDIKYIKNPSENVQFAAMRPYLDEYGYCWKFTIPISPHPLDYIKNPSEKVQLEAVLNHPGAFWKIHAPTSESVQIAAIRTYYEKYHLRYLRITEKMRPGLDIFPEHAYENPILRIEDPSEAVQLVIVGYCARDIRLIVNPAEIVKRAALEQNPSNLRFIQERPLNFGYRKYPTKSNSEMRDMALKAMKPKLEIPTQKTAATGKLPC